MPLNPELMEILLCPACQSHLQEEDEKLVCQKCCINFPIIKGIPVLLMEKSRKITPVAVQTLQPPN